MEKGFNERTDSGEIRTVWEEVDGPKTNEWTKAQMQEYLLDKAKRQDLDEDIVGVLDTPDILAEDMMYCFSQVSERFTIVNTVPYGVGYVISGFDSVGKVDAYLDRYLYVEKREYENKRIISMRGLNEPGEFEHYSIQTNVAFTAEIKLDKKDKKIDMIKTYFDLHHNVVVPVPHVNIKEYFSRILNDEIDNNRYVFNIDPRVITERLFKIITPYLSLENEKVDGSMKK